MENQKSDSEVSTEEIDLDFSDFNPETLSICAFFTFFVVGDHLKHKSLSSDFKDSMTFFGLRSDEGDRVEFCGVQSKEYYKLCDFFTRHNLWAGAEDITKQGSGNGKTFMKVFNKISNGFGGASEDPALKPLIDARQCALLKTHIGFTEFTEEQLDALKLAYGLVAEFGVDNLKKLQPWEAGRAALGIFTKPVKVSFWKSLRNGLLKTIWTFSKPVLFIFVLLFIFNFVRS
jgi:hypothetical protein